MELSDALVLKSSLKLISRLFSFGAELTVIIALSWELLSTEINYICSLICIKEQKMLLSCSF